MTLQVHGDVICLLSEFLGGFLRYDPFEDCFRSTKHSGRTPRSGSSGFHTNQTLDNVVPSRAVRDVKVFKGSKTFLVLECKTPGYFRESATHSPASLLDLLVGAYPREQEEVSLRQKLQTSSLRQQMKYLVSDHIAYGVLTSFDVSYFVHWIEGNEGFHDSLEILDGIVWNCTYPPHAIHSYFSKGRYAQRLQNSHWKPMISIHHEATMRRIRMKDHHLLNYTRGHLKVVPQGMHLRRNKLLAIPSGVRIFQHKICIWP